MDCRTGEVMSQEEANRRIAQDPSSAKHYTSVPNQAPRKKTGRNESCPCGSGKKFKRCCRDKGIQDQMRLRCTVTDISDCHDGGMFKFVTFEHPATTKPLRIKLSLKTVIEQNMEVGKEYDLMFNVPR